MIYVVNGAFYIRSDSQKYQKHSLHKDAKGAFFMEKEAGTIDKLPGKYEYLTFKELLARYGHTAEGPVKSQGAIKPTK